MDIKSTITIENDSLLCSLKAYVDFQKKFLAEESEAEITSVDFLTPKFISPLFTILTKTFLCQKKVKVSGLSSYMEHIKFDDTIQAKKDENIQEHINDYLHKSFFPIVSFPASEISLAEKSKITSAIEKLIKTNTTIPNNILNAINYMLAEISDNILEHASASTGYIYAQSYRTKQFIDVCIGDNGIGLLEAYKKAGHFFKDYTEALHAANDRISAKNLPGAENRGYGLYTSKRILTNGLDGEFMMLSGNCAYLLNNDEEKYITLTSPAHITGTTVLLRIPFTANPNFKLSNFYE